MFRCELTFVRSPVSVCTRSIRLGSPKLKVVPLPRDTQAQVNHVSKSFAKPFKGSHHTHQDVPRRYLEDESLRPDVSSFAKANNLTTFHYRIGENDVWDDEVRGRVEDALKVLLDERNYPSESGSLVRRPCL